MNYFTRHAKVWLFLWIKEWKKFVNPSLLFECMWVQAKCKCRAEAPKGCYNPSPSLKDDILNDMKSTSSAIDIPRHPPAPPLSPFDRFAIFPPGIPFRHWHHFCWYPWITHFIHFSKTSYRFSSKIIICFLGHYFFNHFMYWFWEIHDFN